MVINDTQLKLLQGQLKLVCGHDEFYQKKYADCGIEPGDIRTAQDFRKLPFTTKEELRGAYPLKLQAAPDEEIVRIHSSSGTTGKPIIIP